MLAHATALLVLVLVSAPTPAVAVAFVVSSFTPLHGSYAGGTLVNVSGSGFLRGGTPVSAFAADSRHAVEHSACTRAAVATAHPLVDCIPALLW